MVTTASRIGLLLSATTVAAACNAVLGLEELPRGPAGAAGKGTTGGDAGAAGDPSGGSGGFGGSSAGKGGGSAGKGGASGGASGGSAGEGGTEPQGGAGTGAGGTGGDAGQGEAGGGTGPTGPICGNGVVEGEETCDDDGVKPGDGCDASCAPEDGFSCDGEDPTACTAVCGDSLVVGLEAKAGGCDDGRMDDGDGCDESCRVEPGWFCSKEPSECADTCGNEAIDGAEGCDDGDVDPDDGCDACTVVDGWECDGQPSVCADVNECDTGADDCDANATCTNTDGGFTCACNGPEYTGSGTTGTCRARAWGDATLLEASDASSATVPQIAGDAEGNAIVVWQQGVDIWGYRYEGGAWSGRTRLEDGTRTATAPLLAMNAAGDAVVAWRQDNVDDPVYRDFLTTRYEPGTGWQGVEAVVVKHDPDTIFTGTLSIDPEGNALAVWGVSAPGIELSLYDTNSGWGTVQAANGFRVNAKGIYDAKGNAVVAGQRCCASGASGAGVVANRYEPSNGWLGAEELGASGTLEQLLLDSDGNVVAVWSDAGLWLSTYDPMSGWTDPELVNEAAGSGKMAIDGDGNKLVVFSSGDDLWVVRQPQGLAWGTPELLESEDGTAASPEVAFDANGKAIAVWRQSDGTRYDVFANRFDGAAWGAPVPLESQDGDAAAPRLFVAPNGDAVVTWAQLDGTRSDIWANHFR